MEGIQANRGGSVPGRATSVVKTSPRGAAYVFRFDSDTSSWVEETKLVAFDPLPGQLDRFGTSVALDGHVALIGTEPISFEPPVPVGSAYVFRFDPDGCGTGCSRWVEEAKLVSSDAAGGDRFGFSVSARGDLALIGAWGDDDGASQTGSAYAFGFDPLTSEHR